MTLLILASAAALATLPLPEGRGGARLMPLALDSSWAPAGSAASIRYRDSHGAEGAMNCTTPCTLLIPRGAPFVLDILQNGRPVPKLPLYWCSQGFSGPNLCVRRPTPVASQ